MDCVLFFQIIYLLFIFSLGKVYDTLFVTNTTSINALNQKVFTWFLGIVLFKYLINYLTFDSVPLLAGRPLLENKTLY